MDVKLQHFRQWFLANGGSFGEHVELQYKPERGLHLRVSQSSPLNPASCIVSCPHSLTLSCFNARHGCHPFVDHFGHDAAGDQTPISSPNLLRFFLVEQYQLADRSFWQPYINTLPDPWAQHPFDTPLYYDHDDTTWLHGTSLEHSIRTIEHTWRDEHAQGLRRLRQGNLDRYPWSVQSSYHACTAAELTGLSTNGPQPSLHPEVSLAMPWHPVTALREEKI